MKKSTSISLGSHYDNFISMVLKTGKYKSVSEVVTAGIQLLEEQESKMKILQNALIEGEESGFVKDFDPTLLLEELNQKQLSK